MRNQSVQFQNLDNCINRIIQSGEIALNVSFEYLHLKLEITQLTGIPVLTRLNITNSVFQLIEPPVDYAKLPVHTI